MIQPGRMDVGMEMDGNRFFRRLDRSIAWGLVAALFVYAWFRIGPDLIYYTFGTYSSNPRHEAGWAFFVKTVSQSGGMVLYIGGILSQLFVLAWLGAGTMVFTTGLVYVTVRGLPLHWESFRRWVGWVPVILLMMIWQQYDHPMNLAVGLAINLGMAALLLHIRWPAGPIRIVIVILAMALLYWWTAAASAAFALVMVIEAILARKRIFEGILFGLSAAGLMWSLGTWVFYLEPTDLWLSLTPFHPIAKGELTVFSRSLAKLAFLFTPVTFGLMAIVHRISRRKAAKPSPKHRNKSAPPGGWWKTAVSVGWRIGCVALAGWGLRYSQQVNDLSDKNSLALRAGQAARMGDWRRVVDAATELKRRGIFFLSVIYDVDRALAQMGQLGDRMFEFPQDLSALLYYNMPDEREKVGFDKYGSLMFDLGYMNSAEHMTTEILELEGPVPFVVDRLARVARLKRQDAAARVFETVLSRQIAHRLAQAFRPGSDGTLNIPDARFDHLRQCMPTKDHEVRDMSADELMLDLLANQPKNRMAFEYLMAHYLLTFQQDKVVSQFYRLKDLGFQRLPRHYAEAALIARDKTRGQIDLQGWAIDPEIAKQYLAITQRAKELRMDRWQAAEALAPEFGNSYFFYSMFHVSGVGR